MKSCWQVSFISLIVAGIAGCGDGRPTRVSVSGQVLIDGKPLTRGEINFVPPNGRASLGKLDSEGRFRLTCYEENDGTLLGTHKVSITSAQGLGPDATRWFAPKKYSDYRTSGLTQEIAGPTDNLVINISWDGGHEHVEKEPGASGDEGMRGHRGKKPTSGQ
jgi:hypothetical protein